MAVLNLIFVGFLGIIAFTACVRTGKIIIRAINRLFDKIEDKFC